MIRRLLVLVALIAGMVLVTSGPAGAVCKTPPTPQMAGTGMSVITHPPAHPSKPATRYDTYGLGGLSWDMYDTGCGPAMVREPSGTIGTTIANWMFDGAKLIVGVEDALASAASHPTFLGQLEPVVSSLESKLHKGIYLPWLIVALALAGGLMFRHVRRVEMAGALTALAWSLMVMTCVGIIFAQPLWLPHLVHRSMNSAIAQGSGTLTGSTSTDPAETLASTTEDQILYQSWLQGEFGLSNSATARQFGARLYADKALPWSYTAKVVTPPPPAHVCEQDDQICVAQHPKWKVCLPNNCAHPIADPAAPGPIDKRAADWNKAAADIKGTDPVAYATLTGHNSDPRIAAATFALLKALFSAPFIIASSLLVLAAMLITYGFAIFAPLIGLAAIPHKFRAIAVNAVLLLARAVFNGVIFWVAANVAMVVISYLFRPATDLHPGDNSWMSIVLAGLFTWAMWTAFKPFRRLAGTVTGHNYLHAGAQGAGDRGRGAGYAAKRLALSAIGLGFAAKRAGKVAGHTAEQEREEHEQATQARAEGQPTRTDTPTPAPSPGQYRGEPSTEQVPQPAPASHRVPAQRMDAAPEPVHRTEAKPAVPDPGPKAKAITGPEARTGVFDPAAKAETRPGVADAEFVDGAWQVASPVFDPAEEKRRAEAARQTGDGEQP